MMRSSHGFTLLEISIVLVIIALVAGGAMTGRALVRASEIRTIATDYKEYVTAVSVFKLRFRALPGDMKTATRIWGAADAVPATCETTIGIDKETCDGNGDGLISTSAAGHYERFRFWQQLVNAELIKGAYSGVAGGGGAFPSQQPVIGVNCPKSSLPGAAFYVNQAVIGVGNVNWFAGNYGNFLEFGSYDTNGLSGVNVLTGNEAGVFDQKVDDGLPHRGRVVTSPNTSVPTPNCADGASGGTVYDLANEQRQCPLYLLIDRML